MTKLPELTDVPEHHLDRLPYEVWGREAVQAADQGVADALNAEALQYHHEYMQGATATDEAGWSKHLIPLVEIYGEEATPERVYTDYGSYALMAAEAAGIIAEDYASHRKSAQEAPEKVKQQLDLVRTALADISKKDDPNPDVREAGRRAAATINHVLGSHNEMPLAFREWRLLDAQIENSEKLKPWTDWLAEDATDAQLLNFMQWHNARIQQYNQDPEIRKEIEERREHYIEMLNQVYDAGYLHPAKRSYVMDIVRGANIYAGDDIERALTGVLGHMDREGQFVVLQPALLLDVEATTFEHEMSHFPVEGDELWNNEMAADYLAGIIRSHNLNVTAAMGDMRLDSASAYGNADAAFTKFFKDNPAAAKAFLRWASAPHYLKAECRTELNVAFNLPEGQDALDMMREVMNDHMPSLKTATEATSAA